MTIEVSAFRWVPPVAQGYVRDLRVRWALEEAGLAYEAALVDPQILASPSYRTWNPFGQVPAYRDDSVELFESGAIVLHIAAKSEALAPRDEAGRLRVMSWVIAALSKPGEIEAEAQRLKETALRQMRQDLTVAALVPALGLFIGSRRARGGALIVGLALRLLRRRPA